MEIDKNKIEDELKKIKELMKMFNDDLLLKIENLEKGVNLKSSINGLSEENQEIIFDSLKSLKSIIKKDFDGTQDYTFNENKEFISFLAKIKARINHLSEDGKEVNKEIREIFLLQGRSFRVINGMDGAFNYLEEEVEKERKAMVESKIKREIGESVLNPNNFVAINNFFTELHKQIYQDKILIESKDFNIDSFIELTKQKINHQNDLKYISEDLNDVLYYFNEMVEWAKVVANDIISEPESFNKYVLEDEKLNNKLLDKFKGMLKYHLIEILEQGKTVNEVYPKFEIEENYKNLFISFKNAILDIAEIDKKKYENNLLSKIEEQLDIVRKNVFASHKKL